MREDVDADVDADAEKRKREKGEGISLVWVQSVKMTYSFFCMFSTFLLFCFLHIFAWLG